MTIFDYIVLGIVSISVLLSITRGVVREVVSLLGWIIAFFVASHYAANFEPLLPQTVEDGSLRMLIVFVMTFFVALVVVMVCSLLLSKLVNSVGLGFIDRILGAVFGFARGLLIVLFIVLAAGFTTLPQQSFWQQALLRVPLEMIATQAIPWLPQDFKEHISFNK
ncbi:CvpA family protein [Nitrosomonas sp. Nm33]|uniref:CvpA family protein n=1 Tax=Nitrosomonas sp. Nm33 TaxID=133724 RepID=UPI0008944E1A|nr:CvpA family protein [Nitrosomonas sp. Nm33]SDX91393.1 membrane protein required for colicin V production [Nitrosomonas sp. Nm33]